ncbi:Tyrosine-protein kinase Fps85D [Strongyloides ratti]|uniref:Tyrosine-protein kinase Fps85D n=1 Tax=Strongyloides ratti TaxID=34506 RepID=A0A090L3X8_STRRB|nr:Tyrosine-protein kinase Fps85D [Strongyloides ratti]CEF64521.1 Tyrosine-protein kinase Fps85D [Strongyloides ratti]
MPTQERNVVKSFSVEKEKSLIARKLPDDDIEYLDPIWLYDTNKGKPYFRSIEEQPWFHGYRAKCELQLLLKQEGDWLVSIPEPTQIHIPVITIRVTKKVIAKFTLTSSDEKFWFLQASKRDKCLRYFLNPVDLIEFFTMRTLPHGYRMKNFIYKPNYIIKSCQIQYNSDDDLIDQGTFSSLYTGIYRLQNNKCKDIAIKISRNSKIDEKIYTEKYNEIVKEVKSLSYLIHTNLVLFYGIIEKDPKIRILEYCGGGSLSKHLKKQKGKISVQEAFLYCYEICRGMEYLHSKNNIHKNLKSKNVFISINGSLKVGDFEFNCLPYRNFTKISAFMAPELFLKAPIYSTKSDIWAMAVVIYEIFSNGEIPFESEKEEEIINKITNKNLWNMPLKVPKTLLDYTVLMLNDIPTKRPTFKCLKHFFMENVSVSKNLFPINKMTLNKLPGVNRNKFYMKHSYKETSEAGKSSSSSDDLFRKDL